MTNGLMGYTSRTDVENFLGKTFPEISDSEFNKYLSASERYVENFCGYQAQTTTSGMLCESIVREKSNGKIDNFGNLVIDVKHGPVQFDSNNNPLVSLIEFNLGSVRITLNLTDGTTNPLNTLLEVSENRRKVIYSSMYFLPAISTVTPTAKVNLFSLRDVAFWTDISYIGGYRTIPEDVALATMYLAAEFVQHRNNPMFLTSFSQGSFKQEFAKKSNSKGMDVSESIKAAQALLQPYVINTW